MSYCAKCANYHYLVRLSCECEAACLDCTLSSFRSQISEQRFRPDLTIKCAGYLTHYIPVEEVLEIAAGSTEESGILEELCKVALGHMAGSVVCARSGCGCIGWVDTSKSCSDPVECGLCGHQWVLPQLASTWFRLFPKPLLTRIEDSAAANSISTPLLEADRQWHASDDRSLQVYHKLKSWNEYYWDQQCPHCGTFNAKESTFNNLVYCDKCRILFCWTCQMPHGTHYWNCTNSSGVWVVTIVMLVAALLLKVAAAFLPTSMIWTAIVTVLWFLWLGFCGLFTIALPGICLLVMGVVVCNGGVEAFAGIAMGIGDIGFVVVGIVTGWWSEWFGVLAALAFACCQYNMLTGISPGLFHFRM